MRIRMVLSILIAAALVMFIAQPAAAQGKTGRAPRVTIPASSLEQAGDIGKRAHTNVQILGEGPFKPTGGASPEGLPPFPGYFYETPSSLACIYKLAPGPAGCNPNVASTNPSGGSRAIAIVDAFDDPNAVSDLTNFSAQFGLPLPTPTSFQVIYANGTQPVQDPSGGWEIEESLDIEYAHAMAPNAQLFLVEAASNSFYDLLYAELVAGAIVSAAGGGEISNSWGGGEFYAELYYDSVFVAPNVVFFASSGDSPGTIWPSTSPNVVSVGGTSTNRDPNFGNLLYEGSWTYGGGGPSYVEPVPPFQSSLLGPSITFGMRVTPDVSSDANPITGVWVLDTNAVPGPGWYIVGGTSVSSPTWAGIVNSAGHFYASSAAELAHIWIADNVYGGDPIGLNDIKKDNCGPYGGYLTKTGYDFCTGNGSPNGYKNK